MDTRSAPARRSAPIARLARLLPGAALMALPGVALLGGCGHDSYPSLAIRPAERISASLTPVPGPSPAAAPLAIALPTSGDLASQIAQLVSEAQDAHNAFLAQRAATEAAVRAAASAPLASEDWSVATEALSRLVAARAPTAVALAGLERINVDDRLDHAIADGNAGTPEGRPDAAAIAAARSRILTMRSDEDTVLADLHARLPD